MTIRTCLALLAAALAAPALAQISKEAAQLLLEVGTIRSVPDIARSWIRRSSNEGMTAP